MKECIIDKVAKLICIYPFYISDFANVSEKSAITFLKKMLIHIPYERYYYPWVLFFSPFSTAGSIQERVLFKSGYN